MPFDSDRNFWGWGVNSVVFPADRLSRVVQFLSTLLGRPVADAIPAPSLDDLRMPEPALEIPEEFRAFVSGDRYARATHTYGKAFRDIVRGLSGDYSAAPDLVAYPRNEQQIAALLDWAQREAVAVIPFGGGSSVVGGVEAPRTGRDRYAGVLTLDLCEQDQVLEIDRESRCARVQGGAYGPALERQLKPHGYTLRHFPQSFEFSTVGGWIATRAGGHYATVYTHIDDFVESLRMITPAGIVQTRRLPGNGAGPQEDRLLIGSEGVLGVITEAWLRLQDIPRFRAGCSVRFETFESGAAACRELALSGLFPANARLIQREETAFMGAGDGRHHLLVLGFESASLPQADKLEAAVSICAAQGGEAQQATTGGPGDAQGSTTADQWKQAFMQAPYMRDELVRRGLVIETFETCTTWSNFPVLDAAIRRAAREAMQAQCGGGIITCRFTHLYPDGPAPYYTVIAPGEPGRQLAQWDAIKDAVSRALIDNGATITHHHAVGKDHRPYYLEQNDPLSLSMLQAARRTVDPRGIMNPGTLLPD
jgi:alkyldihydroxyacetonephosphate synthase